MLHSRLAVVIITLGMGLVLSGCGKESRPNVKPEPERPRIAENAGERGASEAMSVPLPVPRTVPGGNGSVALKPLFTPVAAPEPSRQEKYDTALFNGLNLLSERKYDEALDSLEAARAAQDTDQVRQQIDHLKAMIERRSAAARVVQDIETVLNAGKPDEAAKLAATGLAQYGDAADQLMRLKREADALVTAQGQDRTARRERLKQEADLAMRERNLPGASLALEQALQDGDDPILRQQLDDVRATLARYEDNRRRAAELRRDPYSLEDAIAALQEAARAWDTPQVHQEIDEYTLALQKRRERIAVGEFEVRGDVTLPAAGRTVADELLPAFKSRFDLVERGQFARVLDELKIGTADLAANDAGCKQAGRLAKVRYLVLGSITSYNGLTVAARLVEVSSGLVVQTAHIVARSPEEMIAFLPQLANMLLMSDEQKMAYEQQQAQQAAPPIPIVPIDPIPPAPPVVIVTPPPAPVIVYAARPPDFGGLRPADFEVLVPVAPTPPPPVVLVENDPVKERLVRISIELGDNAYRRGNYKEAHTRFQLALNLSPRHRELELRVERCQPHLPPPPPPVIVVAPVVVRPRIAVLNFVVSADPGRAPPGFGDWAAAQAAAYYAPTYDVVDRGEVAWYMGRLGITMRDVLVNPSARVCLGRALNVRYFVFGAIQQTASFNVSTHMVDVESGGKQGGGQIHVQDPQELKLRMNELAHQTTATPAEQKKLQLDAQDSEKVVNDARRLMQRGQAAQAIAVCQDGLKRHPGHSGIQAMLNQAQHQVLQAQLDAQRQRDQQQHAAQIAAQQQKQQQLAREAAAAKQQAEKLAARRTDAERRAQEQQKQKAYDQLYASGHQALQQGNYPQAVQSLQSAVALKPNDTAQRELTLAKTKADEAARAKFAQAAAQKSIAEQKQKDAALAQARDQVAAAKRQQESARLAQQQRDQAAYTKLIADGKTMLVQGKPAMALSNFQSAQKLHDTDEVKTLIAHAQAQMTVTQAPKQVLPTKHPQPSPAEVEKLAKYRAALDAGRAHLAAKRFDDAVASLTQAVQLNPSDPAARTALQQAQQARTASQADASRQVEAKKKAEAYQKAMADGRIAMALKHYDTAIQAYRTALTAQPNDASATMALQTAEKAQRDAAGAAELAAKKQRDDAQRAAQVTQLVNAGRAALNAKQYDAAARSFNDAAKLAPNDPTVVRAMQDLDQARRQATVQSADALQKKRLADYQAAMSSGRQALATHRLDDADRFFREAARLEPTNAEPQAMLREVDKARFAARSAQDPAQKRAQQEAQARLAEFNRWMTQGRNAMTAKRYDEAFQAFSEALKCQPGNPDAIRGQHDADQARKAAKNSPAGPKK